MSLKIALPIKDSEKSVNNPSGQVSLEAIRMPDYQDPKEYLCKAGIDRTLPFASAVSTISDLDTDTRRIVRKLNYINAVVEDYRFFLRSESAKLTAELDRLNGGRLQISDCELEKIAARVTHTRIRADLNEIFDELPKNERAGIISISKPNNYLNLLKAVGFSLDKRYKGRNLCEQCSLIQEALTLHTYSKMYYIDRAMAQRG